MVYFKMQLGFQSSYEDGGESKFLAKAKQNPFVPAGIIGGVGALLYSAYKFRNKGDTKLSVYLIHTRVAAQVTFRIYYNNDYLNV